MSQIQSIQNHRNGLKIHYYNTILKNPYIPVKPYPKQAIPIFEVIKNIDKVKLVDFIKEKLKKLKKNIKKK